MDEGGCDMRYLINAPTAPPGDIEGLRRWLVTNYRHEIRDAQRREGPNGNLLCLTLVLALDLIDLVAVDPMWGKLALNCFQQFEKACAFALSDTLDVDFARFVVTIVPLNTLYRGSDIKFLEHGISGTADHVILWSNAYIRKVEKGDGQKGQCYFKEREPCNRSAECALYWRQVLRKHPNALCCVPPFTTHVARCTCKEPLQERATLYDEVTWADITLKVDNWQRCTYPLTVINQSNIPLGNQDVVAVYNPSTQGFRALAFVQRNTGYVNEKDDVRWLDSINQTFAKLDAAGGAMARDVYLHPKFVLMLSLASLDLNLMVDNVETLFWVLGGEESLRQLVENLDCQDRWRAPTAGTNFTTSTWAKALVPTADKMMHFRPLNVALFADDVHACSSLAVNIAGNRAHFAGAKGPYFGSGKDVCIMREYTRAPHGPGATWLITTNTKGTDGYDLWCEFQVDDDAMMSGVMELMEEERTPTEATSRLPRFRRDVTLERLRAYALYAKTVHPLRILQLTILCASLRNAPFVDDADLVIAVEVFEKSLHIQGQLQPVSFHADTSCFKLEKDTLELMAQQMKEKIS
eukprot:GEMP01037065.1.p1 GENE.GEMP01037065.1~~GEMP01037065.1.p1  ORF type:complete len:588 (+),score=120.96 GEMP01037065.1:28-1764(+)